MTVSFCHLGRPVTEEFSGNIKARAVHYHFGGEHVAQVVYAYVLKSGVAAGGHKRLAEVAHLAAVIIFY